MMDRTIERVLHWIPRTLGLVFAAFVSVFALVVFGEDYMFWQTISALATHLIPTAVVLIALAVSWRCGWAGGLMILVVGAWYLARTWARFHWPASFLIAGPLFLLGLLFEIDWCYATLRTR
jgi:hypothetical protein